jgi:iron complex transport system substrate-binding protein
MAHLLPVWEDGLIGRKHLLVGACGLIVSAALLLRTRAELQRDPMTFRPTGPAVGLPASFPVPRDYVLDPDVVPGDEARGPARIVSLAPSVTETLCALGLADHLVGRTQFCQYPPQIAHVRVVGGLMDTNLEMIRALEPDLVLTTANSSDVGSKLRALGLRHESLPHESLKDVFTAIERAGEICDRPRTARRLVTAIQADLDRLQSAAKGLHPRPMRVLMVCDGLPVPPTAVCAAGPGSFLDALLRMGGQQNAAADLLPTSFGEIPLERLVVLDPEVILTFPTTMPTERDMAQLYRSWSPLEGMQAIRFQRVRPVGGPEWLSAGPRIAVELHQLVAVLSGLKRK